MGNLLRSRDDMISLAQTYGAWRRSISTKTIATTAATANCGKLNAKRFPSAFTVPSFGAGVTAAYMTECGIGATSSVTNTFVGYELVLGSLTVSGNVFSAGTAMPTRTIEGASVVTATLIPLLVVATTLTATTPDVTITYTNQAGTGSRTATLTLPTNVTINSGYPIMPHLQSGDTGVRSVENISISTGSAGVLQVYGMIPQAIATNSATASGTIVTAMNSPLPMFPFLAGDSIGIWQMSSAAAIDIHVAICLLGDN